MPGALRLAQGLQWDQAGLLGSVGENQPKAVETHAEPQQAFLPLRAVGATLQALRLQLWGSGLKGDQTGFWDSPLPWGPRGFV